jgi:serine protease Do
MTNQELINLFQPVIIQITTPKGTGTGFYLKPFHLIVTNDHVVGGNSEVVISGKLFQDTSAKVLFMDSKYDLAFIEPPMEVEFPEVKLSENKVKDGQTVVAIGHPYGLNYTATQGIVSKAERLQNQIYFIQIDAAINPGNSGGPLLDTHGNIIGVNCAAIKGGDNLGFALPVRYLIEDLKEYQPHYGKFILKCYSCETLISEENIDKENPEYCPSCGAKIHWPLKENAFYEASGISLEIEKVLQSLGINVKIARKNTNFWEIKKEGYKIYVTYILQTYYITMDAVLCRLPKQNIGKVYDYLLMENNTLKHAWFSLKNQDIILANLIYDQDFTPEIATLKWKEILENSDNYYKTLINDYGCIPLIEDDSELFMD